MNLKDHIQHLADSLKAHLPNRVVSRELKMIDQLTDDELEKGRYTFISSGLKDIRNLPGCAFSGGIWTIGLIYQFKLPESKTGVDVEDHELLILNELSTWLQSDIDEECNAIEPIAIDQSQQTETPFGWIAFKLEVML